VTASAAASSSLPHDLLAEIDGTAFGFSSAEAIIALPCIALGRA
jgi:hypothetical protein